MNFLRYFFFSKNLKVNSLLFASDDTNVNARTQAISDQLNSLNTQFRENIDPEIDLTIAGKIRTEPVEKTAEPLSLSIGAISSGDQNKNDNEVIGYQEPVVKKLVDQKILEVQSTKSEVQPTQLIILEEDIEEEKEKTEQK